MAQGKQQPEHARDPRIRNGDNCDTDGRTDDGRTDDKQMADDRQILIS